MGISLEIFSIALMFFGIYLRINGKSRLIVSTFAAGLVGSLFFVLVWFLATFEIENPAHFDYVPLIIHSMEASILLSIVLMFLGSYLRISERKNLARIVFFVGFFGIIISGSALSYFMHEPLSNVSTIGEE